MRLLVVPADPRQPCTVITAASDGWRATIERAVGGKAERATYDQDADIWVEDLSASRSPVNPRATRYARRDSHEGKRKTGRPAYDLHGTIVVTGTAEPTPGDVPDRLVRYFDATGAPSAAGTSEDTDTPEREVFRLWEWAWDVSKARRLIEAGRATRTELTVADWVQFMGLIAIDPGHAATVDLDQPVIVGYSTDLDTPLVIDGWDRIYRAHHERRAHLPAYVLDRTADVEVRLTPTISTIEA